MDFKRLSTKIASDDLLSEELTKAGIPCVRTTQRLSANFRIRVYGMLGEWFFYRRVDHWVAKPLYMICPGTPSRIRKFIGKKTDLECDLLQYATEFSLYSEKALHCFARGVSGDVKP